MAKTKKVGKVKVKKKRWFPVFAPNFLGKTEIGESYLNEVEEATGRTLKVNLKDLTGSIKDQNICLSLKITTVAGNNLQTEVVGYSYMPYFIKRMVRRNIGKVEDSFLLRTKDDKVVRIKPLITTVFKLNKSVKTLFRKKIIEILGQEAGKLTFDSLINELLRYKLQIELKKKLKNIHPVREVIIREIKLETGKGAEKVAKVVEVKPVEKTEKHQ
jgi:ribosomal protein S3AE